MALIMLSWGQGLLVGERCVSLWLAVGAMPPLQRHRAVSPWLLGSSSLEEEARGLLGRKKGKGWDHLSSQECCQEGASGLPFAVLARGTLDQLGCLT